MEQKKATYYYLWHFLVFYHPFGGVRHYSNKGCVVRTQALPSHVRFCSYCDLPAISFVIKETIMGYCYFYFYYRILRHGHISEEQGLA
jgi:hypothetical protein